VVPLPEQPAAGLRRHSRTTRPRTTLKHVPEQAYAARAGGARPGPPPDRLLADKTSHAYTSRNGPPLPATPQNPARHPWTPWPV